MWFQFLGNQADVTRERKKMRLGGRYRAQARGNGTEGNRLLRRNCMSGKVIVNLTDGPMKGKRFTFSDHDTFIFGRMEDCHCCLPDDQQISRHHFLIEANPPDACIRDFGSLNGTWVNGKKIGARQKGETPEQGQKRKYPALISRTEMKSRRARRF